MKYNPEQLQHRRLLAEKLTSMLEECGFKVVEGYSEKVFSRPVHTNTDISVLVYSSVFGREVALEGKDAIRVSVVYNSSSKVRPLGKMKRVNRRGDIDDIVNRTRLRMRDAYKVGLNPEKCHCGAPKFTSKKGNLVCAEACWTKNEK